MVGREGPSRITAHEQRGATSGSRPVAFRPTRLPSRRSRIGTTPTRYTRVIPLCSSTSVPTST